MILYAAFLRTSLLAMKRLKLHKAVWRETRINAVFCKGLLQIDSNKIFWATTFCIHFKIFSIVAGCCSLEENTARSFASMIHWHSQVNHYEEGKTPCWKLPHTTELDAICMCSFQCFLTIKLYSLCTQLYFTKLGNSWRYCIITWDPIETAFVQLQPSIIVVHQIIIPSGMYQAYLHPS